MTTLLAMDDDRIDRIEQKLDKLAIDIAEIKACCYETD
jgi:hypothetical protein